jgi:hypothetical protein
MPPLAWILFEPFSGWRVLFNEVPKLHPIREPRFPQAGFSLFGARQDGGCYMVEKFLVGDS